MNGMICALSLLALGSLGVTAQLAGDPSASHLAGWNEATVSGVVSASQTRKPIGGARVNLVSIQGRAVHQAMTDENGYFAFSRIAPGAYTLSVSKPGFVPASYGEVRPGTGLGARAIDLVAGQTFEARLPMSRGAVLTGRILDEEGEPAIRTAVHALRRDRQSGRAQPTGLDITDDLGRYRIYGLAPGEYVVAATRTTEPLPTRAYQPSTLMRTSPSSGAAMEAGDDVRRGYAPVYFPGVVDANLTKPIEIAADEIRDGLDFHLQIVPLTQVEGQVVGASEHSRTHVSLVSASEARHWSIAPASVAVHPDGYFRLTNIPPGNYHLIASSISIPEGNGTFPVGLAPQPRQWGMVTVAVTGSPMADVIVGLQAGVTVTGSLAFVGRTLGPSVEQTSRARVSVVPASGAGGAGELAQQVSGIVEADGSFTIRGVAPGAYRLVGRVDGGWHLRSALIDGQDTLDFPFVISAGAAPKSALITFADSPTTLTGEVANHQGEAVSSGILVLYSADRRHWTHGSRRVMFTQPSTAGRFMFRDIPPGEYRLGLASDAAAIPPNADLLEKLDAEAQTIAVVDGEIRDYRIRVATGPRGGATIGALGEPAGSALHGPVDSAGRPPGQTKHAELVSGESPVTAGKDH
jgi:hypothetical protein